MPSTEQNADVTELGDPRVARARQRVGQVLREKWRLDDLLGVGGMAAVYLATHRNGKEAAVKMLHAEISANADIRNRFLREGYAANKVKSAGAVSVFDDDVAEDGSAYLVMEYLEGETLEARRERKGGRLPADDVLSMIDRVLDTLVAAHDQGIIHRDLKPENLFLTRNGVVKVLDFGIARLQDGPGAKSATQTGSLLGTPAFMAPEQAKGRWNDVDGRTDLWAIGATIFTLLTGKFVHDGETVNEMLAKAITQPAASIATIDPTLPTPVVELVDRALAYEKDKRWPGARSMQEALRAAYHGADVSSVAVRASIPDSEPEHAIAAPEGISSRKPMTVAGVTASARGPGAGGFRKSSAAIGATVVACALVVLGLALRRSPATSEQGTATAASPPSEDPTVPTAADQRIALPAPAESALTTDSPAVDLATIPVQPPEAPDEKTNRPHVRTSARPSGASGATPAAVVAGTASSTAAHDAPPATAPKTTNANILLKRR